MRLAIEGAQTPIDWAVVAETYFASRAERVAERDRWNRVKAQHPPVGDGSTVTTTCTSYSGRYASSTKCTTKVQ